ncbi:MAG: type II toxin-antitoxin system death-on-curing family toxin [Parcubacteria group bacterium]|nr:type II toxin-antitoxin system death-on-curing family toxin [Parcubacteria group bacterium]
MKYLSGEDILVIHSEIIDATGGTHGLRDTGLFLSIIDRPKVSFGGQEMYATVFAKAAVYLEALARYHVFLDGNKRTALAASARFLFLNGYKLAPTNKAAEDFMLRVVEDELGLEEIVFWLKKNTAID